eukprot:SM000006S19401  [mRNA]  locus=s6:582853:583173:+ [translate_table: standard]
MDSAAASVAKSRVMAGVRFIASSAQREHHAVGSVGETWLDQAGVSIRSWAGEDRTGFHPTQRLRGARVTRVDTGGLGLASQGRCALEESGAGAVKAFTPGQHVGRL